MGMACDIQLNNFKPFLKQGILLKHLGTQQLTAVNSC